MNTNDRGDRNGRSLDDLDARDRQLIRLLQEDGRRSNAEIARFLGISEATVRKRVERLIADDIIKIVATVNPRKTPLQFDVIIGFKTAPGTMRRVGEALAARKEVVYLGYTTGRFDILTEMLFHSADEMLTFLSDDLSSLEGVVATETFVVLRNEKINYDWKIPEEWLQGPDEEEDA